MNLAIFDLDHTLILGDSDVEWPKFLMGKNLIDKEFYDKRNNYFYEQYKNGCLDIDEFLDFQLAPLARFSREELDALHAEYLQQHILPIIPAAARSLVQKHFDAGDEVLVITATNQFITAPIVAQFGISNLIAVELEIGSDGRYTGRYVGVPSFKEGKITRLHDWLADKGLSLSDFEKTYFYSDSRNDLPLLELVSNPVAVNADDFLRTHAIKMNWKILDFCEE